MRRSSLYDDGIRLYDQGRFAEAITTFEHVVRETPRGDLNERLAHFYLGEAHTALALQLAGSHSDHSAMLTGSSLRRSRADSSPRPCRRRTKSCR